jgi:hypothetical protein
MKNKYFTPDIEDMSVGYEYELYHQEDGWKKVIFSAWENFNYDAFIYCLKDKEVRVPYLTKEQIEGEGWKFDYNLGDFDYYIKTVNDTEYELEFCYKERININIWKRTLYHGECKDINTFRKIIKLLKI